MLFETNPVFVEGVKFLDVLPCVVRNPLVWLPGFNCIKRSVTLEEEVQLDVIEDAVSIHDHCNHLEGVHQLVCFEDSGACEIIDKLSKLLCDVSKTVVEDVVLLGKVQGVHEHRHVGVEGVFVHFRDVG